MRNLTNCIAPSNSPSYRNTAGLLEGYEVAGLALCVDGVCGSEVTRNLMMDGTFAFTRPSWAYSILFTLEAGNPINNMNSRGSWMLCL